MGRMPGVFARVTLACVRGAALIAAVAVGLVELCCLGSCVCVFVVVCWKILANCCSAVSWRPGNCVFLWCRRRMAWTSVAAILAASSIGVVFGVLQCVG